MNTSLRGIRIVIYLTTIMYAMVNAFNPNPNFIETNVPDPGLFTSTNAAIAVGVVQLMGALIGLIVDVSPSQKSKRRLIGPALAVLVFTYMYELVLIFIYTPQPFRWIPFVTFTVICSVLYIAEEQ
jgi:hypothetical protein